MSLIISSSPTVYAHNSSDMEDIDLETGGESELYTDPPPIPDIRLLEAPPLLNSAISDGARFLRVKSMSGRQERHPEVGGQNNTERDFNPRLLDCVGINISTTGQEAGLSIIQFNSIWSFELNLTVDT